MPYSVRKSKNGGYDIIKKSTGQKVGHSDTLKDAYMSIAHREEGEKHKKNTK